MINSIKEFTVFFTTLLSERDVKIEYLFKLCPIATNRH